MDTKILKLFVDVADAGSFAAVARKSDVDPSTVSRVISSLEEELQLRLFRRSTRKLALTEVGERYLKRIRPLLDELLSAEDEAKSLASAPSGTLKITASVAFGQMCLLPIIPRFREQYPEVKLDIKLTDEVVDLLTEDIDLACRLSPAIESDIVGVRLFSTVYRVVASPDYLLSAPPLETPQDLSGHRCLVFDLPGYRRRWLFRDKTGSITEVKIASDLSISSALALKEAAMAGLGPALLADWLVDDTIEEGRLQEVLPQYRVSATDFDTAAWLLYPSRKYLPRKTRAMVDFLKDIYL